MHKNDIDTNTITAYELRDISISQNDKYNKSGKHNNKGKYGKFIQAPKSTT